MFHRLKNYFRIQEVKRSRMACGDEIQQLMEAPDELPPGKYQYFKRLRQAREGNLNTVDELIDGYDQEAVDSSVADLLKVNRGMKSTEVNSKVKTTDVQAQTKNTAMNGAAVIAPHIGDSQIVNFNINITIQGCVWGSERPQLTTRIKD